MVKNQPVIQGTQVWSLSQEDPLEKGTTTHSNILFFFFCNLFIFNWKIIAVQYWFDFCHTPIWISHRCTYGPSLLSLPPTLCHPSRLLQSPSLSSLNLPANFHWLSILRMVMYMLLCCSFHSSHLLLPPHSSSIHLFSMSASPLLPCK